MFILSVLFLFLVSSCSCGLQEGDPCMSELMKKLEIEGMCKKECPHALLIPYKYIAYNLGEAETELLECGTQDGVKIVCCPTGIDNTSTEAAVTPTVAAVTPTVAAATPSVAPVTSIDILSEYIR